MPVKFGAWHHSGSGRDMPVKFGAWHHSGSGRSAPVKIGAWHPLGSGHSAAAVHGISPITWHSAFRDGIQLTFLPQKKPPGCRESRAVKQVSHLTRNRF
jgi:hypothetical protein